MKKMKNITEKGHTVSVILVKMQYRQWWSLKSTKNSYFCVDLKSACMAYKPQVPNGNYDKNQFDIKGYVQYTKLHLVVISH